MSGFLDLPLELRNCVYDYLLHDVLEPKCRGVMAVSEPYIKSQLPLQNHRGLLRTSRQIHDEVKQAIQHMVAAKKLNYEFDIIFSHGRPYFSLTWIRFPALSPTVNSLVVNVHLRIREGLPDGSAESIPHEHELVHLLEDSPESFAGSLFDYTAILFKTLANLLVIGDSTFRTLYMEAMTVNFRTPTITVREAAGTYSRSRRVNCGEAEAKKLHDVMRNTLNTNAKSFRAFDAAECGKLFPLIQVGALRFAIEGQVWGEGNNLILSHDDFQWLQY